MKILKTNLLLTLAAVAWFSSIPQQALARCQGQAAAPGGASNGFCVISPRAVLAIGGRPVLPSTDPPFTHWDLREFGGCTIPYSFFDGTAQVPGTTEFDQVDLAFATWTGVNPALAAFRRVQAAAGARCPLSRDNHNMLGWNGLNCRNAGDDVCVARDAAGAAIPCNCGQAIPAGGAIIGPGASGFMTSIPNDCPGGGDDRFDPATGRIIDGGNGVINTRPNSALPAAVLALTALFANANSGVLLEADILFNDANFTWQVVANGAATPGVNADVQTVALHEIGHLIGLHHTPAPPEIMHRFKQAVAAQALATGDTDGINFLYTHDLGDAPDPFTNAFNRYPSLVHSTTASRMLNGTQLFAPARGASHLFGIFGAAAAPRYQYEWLGTEAGARIDDSDSECDARVPDRDQFDDGVKFGNFGNFLEAGPPTKVDITVRTAADIEGGSHTYNATRPMFLNGWFDWNADGDWDDPGEHVIGAAAGAFQVLAAGTYSFDVSAPLGAKSGGYARFRLDYREDVNQLLNATDPTLDLPRGAAQFGEVEDYPITVAPAIADQLHLVGPTPNVLAVGATSSIRATVQMQFTGLPNRILTFTRLLGGFEFANGTVSSGGDTAQLTTGPDGSATILVRGVSAGRSLVRVTLVNSKLTAYSQFMVVVP